MSKKKADPSAAEPSQSTKKPRLKEAHGRGSARLVITTGCPAGVGPEISVRAAAQTNGPAPILVGDFQTLLQAAELVGVPRSRLVRFEALAARTDRIPVFQAGAELCALDRNPGAPTRESGKAQLAYINAGYQLVKARGLGALVTAPVNKAAIYQSGAPGSKRFIGHTEWLEALDGAAFSVMCFYSRKLTTALVTTHLPIKQVPRALSAPGISTVIVSLATFLRRLGVERPKLAVCSLNPHASEAGMFGSEEAQAIVPGAVSAQQALGRRAQIFGPIGAETAFRKAYAGEYSGVVAMYHDQATIPMKLVAFGDAVNVTLGLSIDRTSVDHGTAYDIAWKNCAEVSGIESALALAERLSESARKG